MASKVNKGQAKQAKTDSIIIGGQKHTVVKATNGDIVVNHPNSKKTTFKKIDLTKKADVKTVAAGIAAVKKYHKTHPTKGK
jgi:hypothetical protein